MSNKRYRIAWGNDDSTLSDKTIREYQIRYEEAGAAARILWQGYTLTIPAKWLRLVEPDLPEPGHVWFRLGSKYRFAPGLLTYDGYVMNMYGKSVGLSSSMYDIFTAHIPDATITKDELFRQIDAKPTYARRWEELTAEEQCRFVKAPFEGGFKYNQALNIAGLSTLRSAEEFSVDELDELVNAYLNGGGSRRENTRRLANQAIEIAKRSTS